MADSDDIMAADGDDIIAEISAAMRQEAPPKDVVHVPEVVAPGGQAAPGDWAPAGPCPGCERGTPHFDERGRFAPGHNRPHPAGLTPGSRGYNKWLAAEAIEEALPLAAAILIKNLDSDQHWVKHAAAKELLERGLPKEVTQVSDAFAGPVIDRKSVV